MLIVLDLDDTLYLERNYVRSGFKAVNEWCKSHYSLDNFFDEAWSLFESGARKTIFNMVLEAHGLYDHEVILKLVNIYRSHVPSIILEPDADEFLRKHNKNNLALITDGPAVAQWAKIKALGIKKYFSKIIVTEDLGPEYSKPNPRAFELVQDSLSGDSCVYIADNPQKDFIAPASLGWQPSIRFRRRDSLHYDYPTPDHCIEVSSFDDVDFL